jgi:FeS cluster assembly scaffold protein NifU, Clostridium type
MVVRGNSIFVIRKALRDTRYEIRDTNNKTVYNEENDMDGQYSDKVMEHFKNPHNVGEIPDADGIGNVGNPVCGDIMRLYIKVDKGGIITDAKFKTFGCGAAIATSSMVTDLVRGKSIEEALKISNRAVAEALGGLPKIKMHCSVLAEEALRSAINDYMSKKIKA